MIRPLVFTAFAFAAGAALAQDAAQAPAAAATAQSASSVAEAQPAPAPEAQQPALPPLEKIDHVIGKGAVATAGKTVRVHYTGWFYKPLAVKQRGRKFDSSADRGEPIEFTLGAGRVIKGWDQGLEGMKVGGKRTLIIPSHLGYGKRDMGNGAIPPDSDLIFDVELVGVK